MAITPSDVKRVDSWDQMHILAYLFTKGKSGTLDHCGVLDPSGNCWRKGSFGTQSDEGSRFVERMMTVVATLKQQKRNVLAFLTEACEAALRGEAAPSLLPTIDQKESESETAA